jgi:hypothetical protein
MLLAEEVNATVKVYHSERMGLDIDVPDDLQLYFQLGGDTLPFAHSAGSLTITE